MREEVAGAESREGEHIRGHARGEEVRRRDSTRSTARRGEVERRGAVRGRGVRRLHRAPVERATMAGVCSTMCSRVPSRRGRGA